MVSTSGVEEFLALCGRKRVYLITMLEMIGNWSLKLSEGEKPLFKGGGGGSGEGIVAH